MNKRKRKKYSKQHGTYVNKRELWNLDMTITKFVLPRLKLFREKVDSYPIRFETEDEWYDILDKMILAFEHLNNDDFRVDTSDPNWREKEDRCNAEIKEGLNLFAEYYRGLWW